MRSTSYLHNLSLIHFVTFAAVIGSQIHVLSMPTLVSPAPPETATNFKFDASGFTNSFSASETAPSKLFVHSFASTPLSPAAPLSTAAVLTNNKTFMEMNISLGKHSTAVTSSVREGSSTASSMVRNSKSSSKFPLDIKFSKNHWFNSDSVTNAGFSQAAGDVERPRTFRNKHHHEHHWGPFFEEPLNSTTRGDNLVSTAHLFTEAALNCRVGMLKDKTVMWVRRTTEKVSLLTVGNVTYSGDPRIRVKFQYPNNWRLLINPAHWDDAGVYMCQVSTHPPKVFTTNLTILEPPLRLIDEHEREMTDRYYKSGSTIEMQCQVSRSYVNKERLNILRSIQSTPQNITKNLFSKSNGANALPGLNDIGTNTNQSFKQGQTLDKQFSNFIIWAKDDEPLPMSSVRRLSTSDNWLNSRISIPDARLADSGNYSCSIGKLFAAIVQVQVLTGELPAAVQHNSACTNRKSPIEVYVLFTSLAATLFLRITRTPDATPMYHFGMLSTFF